MLHFYVNLDRTSDSEIEFIAMAMVDQ